ncbi:FliM/FliN family flagellar motor switch protein [Paracoccus beibuensis]|uniref:FliM/FliN family flagellar motor switch protein n=1 Tax=Paracoccus beibuensis TaxID=547602 RepID=UPI00223F464B|nr:FliM/FliN family flagellar motor switch protein [Paracoccus beibuensis]
MTPPDQSDGAPRTPQGQGVLRRLLQHRSQARLGQGGAPELPQLPAPTPARAAATAIGRAADRLYGLAVLPISVKPGALTLAELPELLPDLPLVAVLQGPGDNLGAIGMCAQVVAALIEWQALGRVTNRSLGRRRPTRSDALLCSDFINAFLTELPVEMKGVEGFESIAGYRFLTPLDDPRPLGLMLEDKPYRSLSLDLRIGGTETREGRILLALPQSGNPQRTPRAEAPAIAAPPPPAPPRPTLHDVVQDAPVEVHGILCRRRVSLAELRGLTEGRLLSLPRSCLGQATLETVAGQVLAGGKFGEAEGCHAIRLRDLSVPDEDAVAVKGPTIGAAQAPIDLGQPDPFRMPSASLDEAPSFLTSPLGIAGR